MTGAAEQLCDQLRRASGVELSNVIDGLIGESYFVDFKNSATDLANASGLHDDDRNTLSTAVSGFGNSEGGILIWGVDCRDDKKTKRPCVEVKGLADAKRLAVALESRVAMVTVPRHSGVTSFVVGPLPSGRSLVVTHVPKCEAAPLQSVPQLKYYIRSGDQFAAIPHGVLAGMFGRRPTPRLAPRFSHRKFKNEGRQFTMDCSIEVENVGAVVARGAYLTLRWSAQMKAAQSLQASQAGSGRFHFEDIGQVGISAIAHDDRALPPGARIEVFRFVIVLRSTDPFALAITFGADGGPPTTAEFMWSTEDIERLRASWLSAQPDTGGPAPSIAQRLVDEFWLPLSRQVAQAW